MGGHENCPVVAVNWACELVNVSGGSAHWPGRPQLLVAYPGCSRPG